MNINENNKLIAEFLNAPCCQTNSPQYDFSDISIEDNVIYDGWVYLKHMKFHQSWDWLMPVVEKIMNMIKPEKETDGWYAYYAIENNLCLVDIELTYRQVNEFIKWYNNK